MALGLSFGVSKGKTNTTTTGHETQVGTQSGTSDTQSTTTGSQTQNTSGSTASQGTSSTSQTGQTTNTGTGSQTQQQTTELFHHPIIQGLESTVMNLLGVGEDDPAKKASMAGLDYLGHFDPNAYVNSNLAAARSSSDSHVGEAIRGIFDAIGGRNNSQAALLQERIHNEADASLGAQQQGFVQSAQNILNSGIQTATGVAKTGQDFLVNLLGALKGGTAATTGESKTATTEQQNTATTGATNTTEAGQNQQSVQTDTIQQLSQLLTQLLNTTQTTDTTQHTIGKTSQVGGGASVSG